MNQTEVTTKELQPMETPTQALTPSQILAAMWAATNEAAGKDVEQGIITEILTYPPNDAGNAQRFLHLHDNEVRYCDGEKIWYFYKDGRWQRDTRRQVERMARDDVDATYENEI